MTMSRLHCRTAWALLSLVSGKRVAPSMQDSLNPGDRALLRGQDTPYICRAARVNHQLSLFRVTRCSAPRFCEENFAAQEMEVWNLSDPCLSSLPSPLPPEGTTPFSAALLPKGLEREHTWDLGGGYDTVPPWTADPRGSSEGHRGYQVGACPNHHLLVPSQSAASISLPLLTRSSFLWEKVSETR